MELMERKGENAGDGLWGNPKFTLRAECGVKHEFRAWSTTKLKRKKNLQSFIIKQVFFFVGYLVLFL